MGDTLLPEIGIIVSLYIATNMLERVLGREHIAVFGAAVVTAVFAGLGVISMFRVILARYLLLLLVCVCLATPCAAQVITEMTPERIAEAITEGQKKNAKPYEAGDCFFTTPYLRVVLASSAAAAAYRPFTATDVTPDMTAAELEVYVPVDRGSPRRGYGLFSPTSAVVMPKDSENVAAAIQPLRASSVAQRYQNDFGATANAQAILVRFPLTALADRREIRVRYTDGGERRHGLKFKGVR
jgi:hypothetical protein